MKKIILKEDKDFKIYAESERGFLCNIIVASKILNGTNKGFWKEDSLCIRKEIIPIFTKKLAEWLENDTKTRKAKKNKATKCP